ncbi:hypothetical protein ACFRAU_14910 [Arthrobacter sp. NPDC056691]|uniref:hypothetical protein n=1 Tax=Arthrobacter sp. NPDC056691 TaxID=3345913 RepID=UPI0036709FC5
MIAVAEAAGPESVAVPDAGIDDGLVDVLPAVGLTVADGVLLPELHPTVPHSITTNARVATA